MSRTLHFVVWITAVTAVTAYRYNVHYEDYGHSYDYEDPVRDPPSRHDRMSTRSAELPRRDSIRTDERSIAGESQSQSTEDGRSLNRDQMKRLSNVTYKIMNNFAKPLGLSQRKGEPEGNSFIFPGPTATSRNKVDVSTPDNCRTLGICEKVNNYPKELADRLIAELGPAVRFLTLDKLEVPEITQRVGPIQDNLPLCKSKEKISYPEGGVDPDGTMHTILNSESNPIQGFRTEICETESGCQNFVRFDPGYGGKCIQKFVYRTMITIDPKKQTTDQKEIKVPSCCSCVAYTQN